uniref:Uncharacterized protein n=1 Tax=Gossypium raimondii TaxID=29730 RepID=A0A0D2SPF8_GOSRA|nr:hypothetical protein B456_010G082700 [Gossypium raimondii]
MVEKTPNLYPLQPLLKLHRPVLELVDSWVKFFLGNVNCLQPKQSQMTIKLKILVKSDSTGQLVAFKYCISSLHSFHLRLLS